MSELGYRVGIVDLTDGEPTPGCPDPTVRQAESAAAAELLGVAVRETLPFPNRYLFDSVESRVALATVFRRYRPRMVLGFGAKTPMASPDHAAAIAITDAAVFYSRLTKADEQFGGLPPHRIRHQIYYRISFERMLPIAASEFVMDISATLDRKIASIACYASQFPPEKAHIYDRVRAIAYHAGTAAGFAAGEVFASPRALGTSDLLRLWDAENAFSGTSPR